MRRTNASAGAGGRGADQDTRCVSSLVRCQVKGSNQAKVLILKMEKRKGAGTSLLATTTTKRFGYAIRILFYSRYSILSLRVRGLEIELNDRTDLLAIPASTDCGMPQHRHIFIYY